MLRSSLPPLAVRRQPLLQDSYRAETSSSVLGGWLTELLSQVPREDRASAMRHAWARGLRYAGSRLLANSHAGVWDDLSSLMERDSGGALIVVQTKGEFCHVVDAWATKRYRLSRAEFEFMKNFDFEICPTVTLQALELHNSKVMVRVHRQELQLSADAFRVSVPVSQLPDLGTLPLPDLAVTPRAVRDVVVPNPGIDTHTLVNFKARVLSHLKRQLRFSSTERKGRPVLDGGITFLRFPLEGISGATLDLRPRGAAKVRVGVVRKLASEAAHKIHQAILPAALLQPSRKSSARSWAWSEGPPTDAEVPRFYVDGFNVQITRPDGTARTLPRWLEAVGSALGKLKLRPTVLCCPNAVCASVETPEADLWDVFLSAGEVLTTDPQTWPEFLSKCQQQHRLCEQMLRPSEESPLPTPTTRRSGTFRALARNWSDDRMVGSPNSTRPSKSPVPSPRVSPHTRTQSDAPVTQRGPAARTAVCLTARSPTTLSGALSASKLRSLESPASRRQSEGLSGRPPMPGRSPAGRTAWKMDDSSVFMAYVNKHNMSSSIVNQRI